MMTFNEIRNTFFNFFEGKGHKILPSAPIVVKNDPTLMFTNAGMNQFKNIFLGNNPKKFSRVANTQKCLRVSGKHNDLEEVGVDGYHHTMFEMLGNWSFGDAESSDGIGGGYFKKEAIEWAWELLTGIYKLPADRLYATVFEGNKKENVASDKEAEQCWKKIIPEERILSGSKKDNFWEMGETGPCGPCSEIHIDIRSDAERKKFPGSELVNKGNPQVIELWNLVFIQYNRLADGTLQKLPAKHVDTGMGFERLCMVLQGMQSNYDTDVFSPLLKEIGKSTSLAYRKNGQTDIAFRVIADHLRALAFTIADGQIPSNVGAGYVVRRILRRAVRYGFTHLKMHEPFLYKIIPALVSLMGKTFPEIEMQQELIKRVVQEEEESFQNTLEKGLKRLDAVTVTAEKSGVRTIDGKICFELFDTYGFPFDLTCLILKEKGLSPDEKGFREALEEQKKRSRRAASFETDDWKNLAGSEHATGFVGYETTRCLSKIIRYRKIKSKGKEQYQVVLDQTPFYPEGGGQVGDTGLLESDKGNISIADTKKDNNLIVHFVDSLPGEIATEYTAVVDNRKRLFTSYNHTATHLLHAALRQVLGKHVQQKGSLVNSVQLSFDFSHYEKVTDEQLSDMEALINKKIRENISGVIEFIPIEDAKHMGAMALFGEKYSDIVRTVIFDKNFSIELCGGTHVKSTGEIGFFKITGETAVAAGIRRIYAVTASGAEEFINSHLSVYHNAMEMLKTQSLTDGVKRLQEENSYLRKQVDALLKFRVQEMKNSLLQKIQNINGINFLGQIADVLSPDMMKDITIELSKQLNDSFILLGAALNGTSFLTLAISESLVKSRNLNAGNIIRQLAKEIDGGGGGQAHFATAGGKNSAGLENVFSKAVTFLQSLN